MKFHPEIHFYPHVAAPTDKRIASTAKTLSPTNENEKALLLQPISYYIILYYSIHTFRS
jgi:hypothetical protein